MADDRKTHDPEKHRKAHDMADKAVDKAASGDREAAERIADKARRLDPDAVEEVSREIEQDRQTAERFNGKG